jgi:hypothetical protein
MNYIDKMPVSALTYYNWYKGKDKVTVRFQGHENKTAGGVFGCHIVQRK